MHLQVNLAKPRRSAESLSGPGLLRAFAIVLATIAGIALYGFAFVQLTKPLRLESDAGYWLAVGGLSVLAGLLGFTPVLRPQPGAGFIAGYLVAIGLLMAGFGGRRQYLVAGARLECRRALEAATDAHERIRVLYNQGVQRLPSLSRNPSTSLSCRELLNDRE